MDNHSRKDITAWDARKLFKHANIHMASYSLLCLTAFAFCVEIIAKVFTPNSYFLFGVEHEHEQIWC